MNNLTVIVPNDAELFAIAKTAAASHLHLISDGVNTLLSPIVPTGWHKVPVLIKSAIAGDPIIQPLMESSHVR